MDYNVELIKFHKLNPFAQPDHERRLYQNPSARLVLSLATTHQPQE